MTASSGEMGARPGIRLAPPARREGIALTESGDELLIYDKRSHHIHHLNRTSAVVWRLTDGRRTIDCFVRDVSHMLGAPVDREVIRIALTGLDDAGLLAGPLPAEFHIARQSRRTLLRKAIAGGAVAMPMIASMTAPSAAQMVSGGNGLCIAHGALCVGATPSCCWSRDACEYANGSSGFGQYCLGEGCASEGEMCSQNADCCQAGSVCTNSVDGVAMPYAVCHYAVVCTADGGGCTDGATCCSGFCDQMYSGSWTYNGKCATP